MAVKEKAENTISLEEMQAQIAEMLAAAKAEREEAARMLAEAKRMTDGTVLSEERKREIEEDRARGEELVEIKLFKDTGKYKDDVFVGVNGESIAIKRGERVRIKRKFAEVLDNSEHKDYETSRLIEAKSEEFARSGL